MRARRLVSPPRVHGDSDHIVPIDFVRAAVAAHPTWVMREIPDAGHFVHRDRPDEWAAVVGAWLDDLPP